MKFGRNPALHRIAADESETACYWNADPDGSRSRESVLVVEYDNVLLHTQLGAAHLNFELTAPACAGE